MDNNQNTDNQSNSNGNDATSRVNLSKADVSLIESALNFYWNDAHFNLNNKKPLGDLEKIMYQEQLDRSKELMVKLDFI